MKDTGAVIVAAGAGLRFGGTVPKQFLPLCGKPVFFWCIQAFKQAGVKHIVVVVPGTFLRKFKRLEKAFGVTFVAGGKERYHSVQQGIASLPITIKIIAIQDGARPLVQPAMIKTSVVAARKHGAALVAVQSKDTVKLSKGGKLVGSTVPRGAVWLAQTPQTFKRSVIEKAYRTIDPSGITDDAQAAELAGYKVALVPGDHSNIKITHAQDLEIAKILLKQIIKNY